MSAPVSGLMKRLDGIAIPPRASSRLQTGEADLIELHDVYGPEYYEDVGEVEEDG